MNSGDQKHKHQQHQGSYLRFFLMIAISTVVMFFLMYLHSYKILEHAWFSETRLFMTLIMSSGMIVVMLVFMLHMYSNKKLNAVIFICSAGLFITALWLVRSQVTVRGVDYMEGMIPHHSIAILTSERAQIKDQRVRALADRIIKAQEKEIKEMEWLIKDIHENGIAGSQEEAEQRPIPSFD